MPHLFRKAVAIVNPAAGMDFPVLHPLWRGLSARMQDWDIHVTKGSGHETILAERAQAEGADVIVVCGGDGTLSGVVEGLSLENAPPIFIVPTGTSNILAKELHIAEQVDRVLEHLRSGESFTSRYIDLFSCNGKLVLLRVDVGFFAKSILKTQKPIKEVLGKYAYTTTILQQLFQEEVGTYTLQINGKIVQSNATAVMITNSANIGIPNFPVIPSSLVDDSLFDVLLFPSSSLASMVRLLSSSLLQQPVISDMQYWHVTECVIQFPQDHQVLLNDNSYETSDFTLRCQILPYKLKVLL